MKTISQIINLVLLISIILMPSALADELANENALNTSSANSSTISLPAVMLNSSLPVQTVDCLQSQNKYLNYFWKAECKTEGFTDEKGLDKYYFKAIFILIVLIIVWLIAKSVF